MTDQPVAWAGVVLRFADGSWASYEFDDPRVRMHVSTGSMPREELLSTLLSGNVAEHVDLQVSGRSRPWISGVRTSRIQQLEEAARAQVQEEPLATPPAPPVSS